MKTREQQVPRRLWRNAFIALVTIFVLMPVVSSFAGTATYYYDDVSRLIRVEYDNGQIIQYTYDAVGNRTEKQVSCPCITITANAGNGGNIDPSGNICVCSTTQAFTVTPDSCYHIGSVNGCNGTLDGDRHVLDTRLLHS